MIKWSRWGRTHAADDERIKHSLNGFHFSQETLLNGQMPQSPRLRCQISPGISSIIKKKPSS